MVHPVVLLEFDTVYKRCSTSEFTFLHLSIGIILPCVTASCWECITAATAKYGHTSAVHYELKIFARRLMMSTAPITCHAVKKADHLPPVTGASSTMPARSSAASKHTKITADNTREVDCG